MDTRGVFSRCHTTRKTPQHKTQHHTETDRDRERQQWEKRGRKRRRQDKRQEQREERRVKREKIHFQYGGAWPFFVDAVICLVNPVCARDLSLLNSVQ